MGGRQYCSHAFWQSFGNWRPLSLLAQGKLCRCPVTFISVGKETERTRGTLLLPKGQQKLHRLGARKTLPQKWFPLIKKPRGGVSSPALQHSNSAKTYFETFYSALVVFKFHAKQELCTCMCLYVNHHMCVPCVYRVCTVCVLSVSCSGVSRPKINRRPKALWPIVRCRNLACEHLLAPSESPIHKS